MQLARVIGTVVATMKAPNMEGMRLLIVQPLTRRLEPLGQPVVAADALETAGPGELVFIVGAREAAEAMPNQFVPVDHAIVGIADAVEGLADSRKSRGLPRARQVRQEAPQTPGGRSMKLARVVGTVVSTVKSPIFDGRALLLVDLLEPDGREAGGYLIAVDTVGAGPASRPGPGRRHLRPADRGSALRAAADRDRGDRGRGGGSGGELGLTEPPPTSGPGRRCPARPVELQPAV